MSLIEDLRDLADFLERRPDLVARIPGDVTFNICSSGIEDFRQTARSFGNANKFNWGSFVGLRKSFGLLSLDLFVSKSESCERIVLGRKQVPEEVIPAHEEEIVEWRCPQSFLIEKEVNP